MGLQAPAQPLLRAERLSVGYQGRCILEEVTIHIEPRQFWCLLGSNGTGKTTLVRTLLGLLPPIAGRAELDPALGLAGVGFVPQFSHLNRSVPTTIRELVTLGAVGLPRARRPAPGKLEEVLALVGLTGLAKRSFWALSGGQQQRALIARALIRGPRLLVLDEPTSSLDPPTQEGILQLLASVTRSAGLTVLLVTHDLDAAVRYASHAALFHDGRVTSGPSAEMLTLAHLRRVYGPHLQLAGTTPGASPDEGPQCASC